MRAIPTRIHAASDYLLALTLLALPTLLGEVAGGPEAWTLRIAGAILLVSALLTDYELSLLRRLQVPVHLWLDATVGVLLLVSPWALAFDERVWMPHVVSGVVLLLLAGISDTIPAYERRGARG